MTSSEAGGGGLAGAAVLEEEVEPRGDHFVME